MFRKSKLEKDFENLWTELYPEIILEAEVKIIPARKFRFDYVQKDTKVAIEINGGTWGKGGHSSGKGLERDYTKLNLAQEIGYTVFQLSTNMITKEWLSVISGLIKKRLTRQTEVLKRIL